MDVMEIASWFFLGLMAVGFITMIVLIVKGPF